jgi:hypothetical protein
LLDCEVIAAACADAEWLPSLQMMAGYLKQQRNRKQGAIVSGSQRRVISKGVE